LADNIQFDINVGTISDPMCQFISKVTESINNHFDNKLSNSKMITRISCLV